VHHRCLHGEGTIKFEEEMISVGDLVLIGEEFRERRELSGFSLFIEDDIS
jgi:hypothetical protein